MAKEMEKELCVGKEELNIKENLKMVLDKEKEYVNIIMVKYIMENGIWDFKKDGEL